MRSEEAAGVVAAASSPLGSVGVAEWALAVAPILLLVVLVVRGRRSTPVNATVTLAVATLIAAVAFGATPLGVAVALGKGAWTGLWILLVIWAALFLHAACRRVGLDGMGEALTSILRRRTENVLVVAWIFPSFVQGVAGFGTPIAVTAPLLILMGVRPVLAVALPLIGYHWAVGFGSVGSSFYMGAFTAGLSGAETAQYAQATAWLLGANAVLSGVLVALMFAGLHGLREGWRLIVLAGPAMAAVQAVTVRFEPGVGALAAGGAGLLVVAVLAVVRADAPSTVRPALVAVPAPGPGTSRADEIAQAPSYRRLALVLLPYALLLLGVLGVLLPPASRTWARSTLAWGPSFPATETRRGFEVAAVSDYQTLAALGHPASFIVFATLVSVLLWRLARRWPRRGLVELAGPWLAACRKASPSVVLLASLATVMADTGMVRTVAVGAAEATGPAFPLLAGLIGAVGSFTTGSTTSSNALFSALQADVARLIDVPPSRLLAA
ncbi:MAG: L-lactate permease, partial [Actinomycetota bacterium]|nr:L-lactate permease [Actinomycetota bacterium]